MNETRNYTVIFLVDRFPARNILLLKRASSKPFAPNYYTGIGGKVGDMPQFRNETILEGAYRELEEETLETITQNDIHLTEFARFRYQNGISLFYFAGVYTQFPLTPAFSANDGELEWVNHSDILHYKIIPTTKLICEVWAQNDFQRAPFTIFGKEVGMKDSVRIVEKLRITNHLL